MTRASKLLSTPLTILTIKINHYQNNDANELLLLTNNIMH